MVNYYLQKVIRNNMSAKYDAKKESYRARNKNTHNDMYPTYHDVTEGLVQKLKFNFDVDAFVSPAAGAGDIANVVKRTFPGIPFLQSDLFPRKKGIRKNDFIENPEGAVPNSGNLVLIENPPFKLSIEFFEAAAASNVKEAYFLWPLDYLHGYNRRDRMFNYAKPGELALRLDTVYPFVRRPHFDWRYRADGPMPTGSTSFAWFKFKRIKSAPSPKIDWIDYGNFGQGIPVDYVKEGLLELADIRSGLKIPVAECVAAVNNLTTAKKDRISVGSWQAYEKGTKIPTKEIANHIKTVLMTDIDFSFASCAPFGEE